MDSRWLEAGTTWLSVEQVICNHRSSVPVLKLLGASATTDAYQLPPQVLSDLYEQQCAALSSGGLSDQLLPSKDAWEVFDKTDIDVCYAPNPVADTNTRLIAAMIEHAGDSTMVRGLLVWLKVLTSAYKVLKRSHVFVWFDADLLCRLTTQLCWRVRLMALHCHHMAGESPCFLQCSS